MEIFHRAGVGQTSIRSVHEVGLLTQSPELRGGFYQEIAPEYNLV